MHKLFRDTSFKTSRLITKCYSTSFSSAVNYLDKETADAIYSIYGFVRLADEIVDSFLDYDRAKLLWQFERDYDEAVEAGISLNPVMNSFRETVKTFSIPDHLIRSFLRSMKSDLVKSEYNSPEETSEYIYGSAEVVGLMCLIVFVKGDKKLYEELKEPARMLGAAFQKVNFIRDIGNDLEVLERNYFHMTSKGTLSEEIKNEIISGIHNDFKCALPGVKKLPGNSRTAVFIAYYYYMALLKKIERTPAIKQYEQRIRIPDLIKLFILGKTVLLNKLRII